LKQKNDSPLKAGDWFASNKLCLNREKTVNMLFTLRHIDTNFDSNKVSTKFLGIINNKLLWNNHAEMLCNIMTLRTVHFALFESAIIYGLLVWGHSYSRNRIFAIQRRVLRILAGLHYREDYKTTFVNLKILTFPSLYIYHCLLYVKSDLNHYFATKIYMYVERDFRGAFLFVVVRR
jgi:hypothetical protein